MTPRFADYREHIQTLLRAALAAADPAEAVRRHWPADELAGAGRVFVVGAGKACAGMAVAAAELLGPRLAAGALALPRDSQAASPDPRLAFIAAGHPQPDAGSLHAGQTIADLLAAVTERDVVLALFSGGGSALLELPVPGHTLETIQQLNRDLLRSGAPITEVNCIRKHLSRLKGGGLARLASPARVIALILSDVVGDPLDAVASGPAVPDPTTVADAQAIARRYGLTSPVPFAETPKPGDAVFNRVTHHLIGSNTLARRAAAEAAPALGFAVQLPDRSVEGEARDWGQALAREVLESIRASGGAGLPWAAIYGGEPTVTVRGDGVGGRNQELALAAAIALDWALEKVALGSVGTDGRDGDTPVAGAVASPGTVARARALGLDAPAALANNDSYSFFAALGDCIITGPTGTNVNDLVMVLAYAS
ncbi:MAG: DUF4147 domain-containing protein [Chloroflexi bacterium]|nr:DUF4147 domain-containing protein [Chloroflexota bacterium]